MDHLAKHLGWHPLRPRGPSWTCPTSHVSLDRMAYVCLINECIRSSTHQIKEFKKCINKHIKSY